MQKSDWKKGVYIFFLLRFGGVSDGLVTVSIYILSVLLLLLRVLICNIYLCEHEIFIPYNLYVSRIRADRYPHTTLISVYYT